MPGRVVFVAGYCAGGKTAFARKLSSVANVPSFNKDTIKETIGNTTGEENFWRIQEIYKWSRVTENLMRHIAGQFMGVGWPFIIESNFRPAEMPAYKALLEKYGYKPLTFVFHGDMPVFHKRFHDRELTSERHFANRSEFTPIGPWAEIIAPLKDFDVGGKRVFVDTTDFSKVNFDELVQAGAEFLAGAHFCQYLWDSPM